MRHATSVNDAGRRRWQGAPMLVTALALVLAQTPRLSPTDPWKCPGFKVERLWQSDSKLVPLGFSRSGRFAVARRFAEVDMAGRTSFTRGLSIVELRTDRVRRYLPDFGMDRPAEALDAMLVDDDVVQTCPVLDDPPLPVQLTTTLGKTEQGWDSRRTELLLRTPLGVKRLVREDFGARELRYAGSVTSPYEPRAALLLVELGKYSSVSAPDTVLAVHVVGTSLKEGFAREPPADAGPPLAPAGTARPGPAAPLPSERFAAVGFSKDGRQFTAAIAPPTGTEGNALTWDVATGKPAAPTPVPFAADGKPTLPAALTEAASDPGREGYTSGTKSATTVKLSPVPLGVDLVAAPAQVVLSRGPCRQTVPLPPGLTELNLVSVLTSSADTSVAVVVKATSNAARRFHVATASLSSGPLSAAQCQAPVRSSADVESACLAKLRGLRGGYAVVGEKGLGASISDHKWSNTQQEFSLTIASDNENVGGDQLEIAGCTLSQGRLLLQLDGYPRRACTLTPNPGGGLTLTGDVGLCTSPCVLRPTR